jgi:hypothetical protein
MTDLQALAPMKKDSDTGLDNSGLSKPDDAKWDKGPMILALSIPLVFLVAALIFMALAYRSDKGTGAKPQAPEAIASRDLEIERLKAEVLALQNKNPSSKSNDASVAQALSQRLPPTQTAVNTGPDYNENTLFSVLTARLDRLEATQSRLAQAAVRAAAAQRLERAAHLSSPFVNELNAIERTFKDTRLTKALRTYAYKGVSTQIALTLAFSPEASKANAAAKPISQQGSLLGQISRFFSGLISIRRIDGIGDNNVDAIIYRAEIKLNQGDLEGALAFIDSLPEASKLAIKPWLDEARARLEVDRTAAEISRLASVGLSEAQINPETMVLGGGV